MGRSKRSADCRRRPKRLRDHVLGCARKARQFLKIEAFAAGPPILTDNPPQQSVLHVSIWIPDRDYAGTLVLSQYAYERWRPVAIPFVARTQRGGFPSGTGVEVVTGSLRPGGLCDHRRMPQQRNAAAAW